MTNFPLQPPAPTPLQGDEPFDGIDATVLDFWRFALSNLKMNNIRGYLAEFLVARAVGAQGRRIEWDAYDVLAPDGTKIEVKTSAYLQAWEQRYVSRIGFSGLRGRTLDSNQVYTPEQTFNADVYVFAVQTARTHEEYDALSVSQWQFYVLPRAAVDGVRLLLDRSHGCGKARRSPSALWRIGRQNHGSRPYFKRRATALIASSFARSPCAAAKRDH